YLLYLPGSIMASIGFLRQSVEHHDRGLTDISRLMLGAGLAFMTEAIVVGLIVPAAPYGPVSYYNYDRDVLDSAPIEQVASSVPFSMVPWLDYDRVLEVTSLPVQFWRMLSALAMIFFVVRSLGVFDAMERRRIEKLQSERDRAQLMARHVAESWTEALVSISRHIAELDDLDEILLDIVRNAHSLLNSDFVAIGMLDDTQQLTLYCYADNEAGCVSLPVSKRTPITNPLILETIQHGISHCIDESEATDDIDLPRYGIPAEVRAIATVPLLLDNYPIGALWSARFSSTSFTATDLIGLERLADQVVIAIQHGLMATQIQSLAVVDERSRIAREMHDGLAQILGYMNVQVQTVEALVLQGKQDRVLDELQTMREAVRAAHADVRENILSLRTTLATDAGVTSAISKYLEGFSSQTGISVHFANAADNDERLGLSPMAEVQLVCILHEALANVRKHAHAQNVKVSLYREGQVACLEIHDDGVGFTSPISKNRFGLHTMLERAQSVGGKFWVQSEPGQGTHIFCKLPEVEKSHEYAIPTQAQPKRAVPV
ncbi:GAF domain-containing protein, partial [Candidatus Saccharibacteria bacterium]|nr:GAF domain-containing protein [Candidatus Saccharibacteria bacterium]